MAQPVSKQATAATPDQPVPVQAAAAHLLTVLAASAQMVARVAQVLQVRLITPPQDAAAAAVDETMEAAWGQRVTAAAMAATRAHLEQRTQAAVAAVPQITKRPVLAAPAS